MNRPYVPQDIVDLAHARREARGRRAWDEADEFKARIEAAGWRVVDRGVDFDLRPARPPDVEADGAVRYGSSGSVPSRLEEPDAGLVSVVVVLDDDEAAAALLAQEGSVAGAAPADSTIAVANGLGPGVEGDLRALGSAGVEVVRLAIHGTPGAARDAGCRRATGAVIVLVGGTTGRTGAYQDLAQALEDAAVAIAGTVGLVSAGLPRFAEAARDRVDAVSGDVAFRRADYRDYGPFDERFTTVRELDIWWSLTLRDAIEDQPRRAERTGGAAAAATKLTPAAPPVPETPGQRRDRYRILDAFRGREHLLSGGSSGTDRG